MNTHISKYQIRKATELLTFFMQIPWRQTRPHRPIHNPAGDKLRRAARNGTLTMCNVNGIAGESVKNISRDKALARIAEKRAQK